MLPCVFPRFSGVFFSKANGRHCSDNKDSTTEKQSEQEASTLISVLTGMKASIDSGNSLLQELVSHGHFLTMKQKHSNEAKEILHGFTESQRNVLRRGLEKNLDRKQIRNITLMQVRQMP